MTIKTKWRCCECDDVHDDEGEARECCRPSVREVYLCPKCEDWLDSEEEAMACCETSEPELSNLIIPREPLPIDQYIERFEKLNGLKRTEEVTA